MRLFAILSLVLVGATTLRSEAPPIEGTLPEDYLPALKPLLKAAVERSPATITATIAVALADAGRIGADAPLSPQLGLSSNYAVNRPSSSTAANTQDGFFY